MGTETGNEEELAQISDVCFAHLVSDPDHLNRFMVMAGHGPESLRKAIGTRALALGMMDYFASNEPALLEMCRQSGMAPERFMRLWHRVNRQE